MYVKNVSPHTCLIINASNNAQNISINHLLLPAKIANLHAINVLTNLIVLIVLMDIFYTMIFVLKNAL
jgi:hypothetical protein